MKIGLIEEQRSATGAAGFDAPALEAHDVWFAYSRKRQTLKGISLSAAPGKVTMILGVSGGGKTTLLKLAKGLLRPRRGSVKVLGRPVAALPEARRLDPRVAFIPQHLGLARGRTALENTLTGALARVGTMRSLLGLFPRDCVEEAWSTLESLGIAHKADERVSSLSGGERQRVAIARALMQRPRLLLADESVSHLDPVTCAGILELIAAAARGGMAVVMTTHQLEIVSQRADRVVVLRDGEIALDCPVEKTNAEELRRVMKP
ncbi:MAG: ATP-binding cassette domain-containing protein [Acidobacteria bacterium]|nr:ATP-binding cassette domain-containing protein [Acidobacteriota bacterium]